MWWSGIIFIVNLFLISNQSAEIKGSLSVEILRERETYAAKMLSYMNTSVDPCDDFYDYACGNYFTVNPPKLGIRIQSALLNIENQEIEAFREILMEPLQNKGGSFSAADKVKSVYQACIQANIFEYKKSEAYLKLIESLGGWPALNTDWKPENFDWFQVMTILKQHEINIFVNEEVRTDQDCFIELKPESFGLIELMQEYLNLTTSRAYQLNQKLSMKIMDIYGVPRKEAKQAFEEILEFGEIVALDEGKKLIMDLAAFQVTSLMSISNLSEEAPAYDWEKYFETITGEQVNTTQSNLFIPALILFKDYPELFQNKSIIRGAANYAILKLLFELHKEFRSPQYPERFCFFQVQKYMSTAASLLYFQSKHRSMLNENEAWTVLHYIRTAFKETIMSLDWLDKESKRRTIAKVENMEIFIGYSNQTWDIDAVEAEYKDLQVSQDDFYENNLRLRKHYQKTLHKFCLRNHTVEKKHIEQFLLIDLNAFYMMHFNKLIIPAVLLIKPYVYPELPKSYNFGSIGRTIGHEMVHGFDSMGKLYNEYAKMETWWSNDTMRSYDEREQCIEEQYNDFKIPELNINISGEDSIQENIADNGGIRQSYYGYKKWLEENEGAINIDSETLPGLNLTNHQLFFLSFGQMFCTRYNSRKAYKLYIEGSYAVEKYRLVGSLSNFNEFSKHFNCERGSKMNPDKKCILW